ncbi:hypothetical protein O181_132802 [Austropuccinia psidii MF-1]|uniref:Uncharacterized protein n=1 Tax=Austropuccinia psidii MF-1 TaxID=1389203 RepID=A0A9Q3L7S8_9BASI|nr:hypothetical protein [Austropuccinia psidii MF-1]
MIMSGNVVRQANIGTASTDTSIIPSSITNSDYNTTVIITQKNKPEPISSELINLDITSNHKLCLQPDQQPAITPQAALKKVIDMIIEEANQLQKGKASKRGETATRNLIGHIQSQPEGLQQCIAPQRVPDPCRSVEKLHEFLPDCEKIPEPSQYLQVTQ